MNENDEIIKEFLVESSENLDQLDRDLVLLEDTPDDRQRLSSVFRAIHTIKGTCGFLGFPILEHVAHVGESLLVRLRDGELQLDGLITNALLAMVDAIRTMLNNVANTNSEGKNTYVSLIEELEQLQSGPRRHPVEVLSVVEQTASGIHHESGSFAGIDQSLPNSIGEIEAMVADLTTSPTTVPSTKKSRRSAPAKPKSNSAMKARSESKLTAAKKQKRSANKCTASIADDITVRSRTEKTQTATEVSLLDSTVLLAAVTPALTSERITIPNTIQKKDAISPRVPVQDAIAESTDKSQAAAETTVRLDVTLLDKLMNLVGELVLIRNQILQYSPSTEDASLIAASQRLNLITTELQAGVMKTRMQPIQNAWAKLPRVIRDVSMTCGKKVQIKMEGAETELDKTILEAIRDPLTHIVRNSVDHGIETPEVRVAKGKPAEGTLELRAFHEGGQVNIEISDDGGGINLERVRQKAISQNLITLDQAASMSERELLNLILLPGFSTAATVTNVSGRGVGMDVVKTNIDKIGGTLEIHSVLGEGTTLRIRIPLTLAIVPALMVTCGDDRYAIPQNNLVELVRLEGERVRRDIERVHNVPVYRLRGNLLPLLYLDEQLELKSARFRAELSEDSVVNIVVLSAENRQFGLVVDGINDTQEIVVKPLGQDLKEISAFAGVTILGDGAVALILDVQGIAKRARVVAETHDRRKAQSRSAAAGTGDVKQTLLLLGLGCRGERRMAIPLSVVARLEEIAIRSIEQADGQQVVQYGNAIMPLIFLRDILNPNVSNVETMGLLPSDSDTSEKLQVVVYCENGRSVGLVVDRILDIVETSLTIQHTSRRVGVLGSAVIQERVTDLLDIQKLILAIGHESFAPRPTTLAI